jgi:hypothetical protein
MNFKDVGNKRSAADPDLHDFAGTGSRSGSSLKAHDPEPNYINCCGLRYFISYARKKNVCPSSKILLHDMKECLQSFDKSTCIHHTVFL